MSSQPESHGRGDFRSHALFIHFLLFLSCLSFILFLKLGVRVAQATLMKLVHSFCVPEEGVSPFPFSSTHSFFVVDRTEAGRIGIRPQL